MKTGLSKWAVGDLVIEWCARNGLDATRIPDRSDAIVTGTPPDPATGTCRGPCRRLDGLYAHVWHVLCVDEVPFKAGPDVIRTSFVHDEVEYLRCVPVDSDPPLNPEWVALFGGSDTP